MDSAISDTARNAGQQFGNFYLGLIESLQISTSITNPEELAERLIYLFCTALCDLLTKTNRAASPAASGMRNADIEKILSVLMQHGGSA